MDGWSGRNRFFGKAGEEHELLELDPWRRPAGRRDYCGSQYASLPQERWPVRPSVGEKGYLPLNTLNKMNRRRGRAQKGGERREQR